MYSVGKVEWTDPGSEILGIEIHPDYKEKNLLADLAIIKVVELQARK